MRLKQWNNVIFTDESKFNLITNDGKRARAFYRDLREKLFRGEGISRWDFLSYKDKGPVIEVTNSLNAYGYISAILDQLHKFFSKKFKKKTRWTLLMQDTAPYHRANVLCICFEEKNLDSGVATTMAKPKY